MRYPMMKQRPVIIAGPCLLLAIVLTSATLAQSARVLTDQIGITARHPIMSWEVTGPYHTDQVSLLDYPGSYISRAAWLPMQADSSGLVNLGDQIDREEEGSSAVIARHVFFSPHDQVIDFNFGFADTIVVFFNSEALFLGRNAGDLSDPAFSRDHRCSLHAREGLNEILFVVRSASDIWGFAAGTDIRLEPPPPVPFIRATDNG